MELATSLTARLLGETYECMICYEVLRRRQPIWHCTSCWALFHLPCISTWASSSLSSSSNQKGAGTWRCPGCQQKRLALPSHYACFCGQVIEPPVDPFFTPHSCGNACQRPYQPSMDSDVELQLTEGRRYKCPHRCPHPCHPGPCGPCPFAVPLEWSRCYCGRRRETVGLRCKDWLEEELNRSFCCSLPCLKRLECEHVCRSLCHPGECPRCPEMLVVLCKCGKSSKSVECGQLKTTKTTSMMKQNEWSCDQVCGALFSCGVHTCSELCHVHETLEGGREEEKEEVIREEIREVIKEKEEDVREVIKEKVIREKEVIREVIREDVREKVIREEKEKEEVIREENLKEKSILVPRSLPDDCPWSPQRRTHCPCGRQTVDQLLAGRKRTRCTDPVPLCSSPCGNVVQWPCGHQTPCSLLCHHGPCRGPNAECTMRIEQVCACGQTIAQIPCCGQVNPQRQRRCDRICKRLLECGRHTCRSRCCNRLDSHRCLLKCKHLLKCGRHTCQRPCHPGPCGPCMQPASVEEEWCGCGRTHQKILCGSEPQPCPFPCDRPRPCGHSSLSSSSFDNNNNNNNNWNITSHDCHPRQTPCPPCLVPVDGRRCLCGKLQLTLPCSHPDAQCRHVCEKRLPCGHRCRRSCHRPSPSGGCLDERHPCLQRCGRKRRSCGHPCTQTCHPRPPDDHQNNLNHKKDESCSTSTEPCSVEVQLSCSCGRQHIQIRCGSTTTTAPPVCNDACAAAERNRRIALALGLDPSASPSPSASASTFHCSDFLLQYTRLHLKWVQSIEHQLHTFITSPSPVLRFPSMRADARRFICTLVSEHYLGLQTEQVDREPHRSVVVHKRRPNVLQPPLRVSVGVVQLWGSSKSASSLLDVSGPLAVQEVRTACVLQHRHLLASVPPALITLMQQLAVQPVSSGPCRKPQQKRIGPIQGLYWRATKKEVEATEFKTKEVEATELKTKEEKILQSCLSDLCLSLSEEFKQLADYECSCSCSGCLSFSETTFTQPLPWRMDLESSYTATTAAATSAAGCDTEELLDKLSRMEVQVELVSEGDRVITLHVGSSQQDTDQDMIMDGRETFASSLRRKMKQRVPPLILNWLLWTCVTLFPQRMMHSVTSPRSAGDENVDLAIQLEQTDLEDHLDRFIPCQLVSSKEGQLMITDLIDADYFSRKSTTDKSRRPSVSLNKNRGTAVVCTNPFDALNQ